MKCIIAGSRGINDIAHLIEAIEQSGFEITEVVSGMADNSPDMLGVVWAKQKSIPIKPFPAEWSNKDLPGAIMRVNKWGQVYNVNAGYYRNQKMADYGECLIALHDGKSKGTLDMINRAMLKRLPVHVFTITRNRE